MPATVAVTSALGIDITDAYLNVGRFVDSSNRQIEILVRPRLPKRRGEKKLHRSRKSNGVGLLLREQHPHRSLARSSVPA
jgi:hypothetical protein